MKDLKTISHRFARKFCRAVILLVIINSRAQSSQSIVVVMLELRLTYLTKFCRKLSISCFHTWAVASSTNVSIIMGRNKRWNSLPCAERTMRSFAAGEQLEMMYLNSSVSVRVNPYSHIRQGNYCTKEKKSRTPYIVALRDTSCEDQTSQGRRSVSEW